MIKAIDDINSPTLWKFFKGYAGFLPESYSQDEESTVVNMLNSFGVNSQHLNNILCLFLAFRNKLFVTGFSHTRAAGLRENLKAAEKIRSIMETSNDPELLSSLSKSLAEIEETIDAMQRLKFIGDTSIKAGRPTDIDSELIKSCAPIAKYLYTNKIIPGKKPGTFPKEVIYHFLFDFLKAAGFPLSKNTPQENIQNIKDYLKADL